MSVPTSAWYVEGVFDDGRRIVRSPLGRSVCRLGRGPDCDLRLASGAVSARHAELRRRGDVWTLEDLGSTNGTFVNGRRVESAVEVGSGDRLRLGDLELRLSEEVTLASAEAETSRLTGLDGLMGQIERLDGFRQMLADGELVVGFQPVVALQAGGEEPSPSLYEPLGYEALGRGLLHGELTPPEVLFPLAEQLGRAEELSTALRRKALEAAQELPGAPVVFVNTHPLELEDPETLEASVAELRRDWPTARLVLELHEAGVADPARLGGLSARLRELQVGVAFDDFGTGRARLLELMEAAPEFLKFDAAWSRQLHRAQAPKQQLVRALLELAGDLGVATVAEGIESREEAEAARSLGFDYGQGFFFGRPRTADDISTLGPAVGEL